MASDADKEMADLLAGMRASGDQAIEATKDIARMLGSFRNELVKQGFSHDEAAALANTKLQLIFALMMGGGED